MLFNYLLIKFKIFKDCGYDVEGWQHKMDTNLMCVYIFYR